MKNVSISKCVEKELKCFVLNVRCLFVMFVIHLIFQLFSLETTNVNNIIFKTLICIVFLFLPFFSLFFFSLFVFLFDCLKLMMILFRKGGLDVLKKKQCSKHNSQVVSGFCFVCCEFVCVCCLLEKHDEHKKEVRSLEESVCKKREEVVKIGVRLENRLKKIEERKEKVEKEIKNLEKELEMKRVEKKEIELEKEDLRMRQDTIIRLSNTLPDISLFEEHLFSSLLETANDIVNESSLFFSTKREKGVICGDGLCFVSSFQCDKKPYGVSVNRDGNFLICEDDLLRVRDREWNVIESVEKAINSQKLDPS